MGSKTKISVLTWVFITFSVISIFLTWDNYELQKEKGDECLASEEYKDDLKWYQICVTFSFIYFDRFINGMIFSVVFISLSFLSWKVDILNKNG